MSSGIRQHYCHVIVIIPLITTNIITIATIIIIRFTTLCDNNDNENDNNNNDNKNAILPWHSCETKPVTGCALTQHSHSHGNLTTLHRLPIYSTRNRRTQMRFTCYHHYHSIIHWFSRPRWALDPRAKAQRGSDLSKHSGASTSLHCLTADVFPVCLFELRPAGN